MFKKIIISFIFSLFFIIQSASAMLQQEEDKDQNFSSQHLPKHINEKIPLLPNDISIENNLIYQSQPILVSHSNAEDLEMGGVNAENHQKNYGRAKKILKFAIPCVGCAAIITGGILLMYFFGNGEFCASCVGRGS